MANTEPKVRTRTKTRGDVTITKTKEKKMLPGGGKVKSYTKVVTGPSGTLTVKRDKVKGAEDIQGRKEKSSSREFVASDWGFKKKSYKSKDKLSKTKRGSFELKEVMPKETYRLSGGKKVTIPERTEIFKTTKSKDKSPGKLNVIKTMQETGRYDSYGNEIVKPMKVKKRSKN